LTDAWNAAFCEFLKTDGAYQSLFEQHIGERREPPQVEHADYPARAGLLQTVTDRGVVRLGSYMHAPFCYEEDGVYTGFEHALAAELFERIRIHYGMEALHVSWVHVPVVMPEDGNDADYLLEALRHGLDVGAYDMVVSGSLKWKGDAGYPTMDFNLGALYTGAGDFGEPPSDPDLVRQWLIDQAAAHDVDLHVICSFGGMQTQTADTFAKEIGGTQTSMFIGEIIHAIESGDRRHVYIGDGIQIAYWSRGGGPPYDLGMSLAEHAASEIRPWTLSVP
jgi:hypothetical protein